MHDLVRPIRVAHLVSHAIPYFVPLYRELEKRPEIDLTVYFYSDATTRPYHDSGFDRTITWSGDLLSGYSARVLPSAQGTTLAAARRRPHLDLLHALRRGRYDAIWAHGYAYLTTWLAEAQARVLGTRFLLREEQTLDRPRNALRRVAKTLPLRLLLQRAICLYIGEANRLYLEHYGAPASRLFPARYCVDNERFQQTGAKLSLRRRDVRAAFGITDNAPVIMFCGKLAEVKEPLLLLRSFAKIRAEVDCWLLLVGDGPLRAAVVREVEQDAIPGVVLVGFLGQEDLPRAYVAADIFALPSRSETWGLVVNEAMNFRLPLVLSDRVGCAADLLEDGWNGFLVPHGRADALALALHRLVEHEELRRVFGERSRDRVAHYSVDACADGIVAACLAACSDTCARRSDWKYMR